MLGRIFAVSLLAGLAAGLAVSVLQEFTTMPIIIHAEEFENKGPGGPAKLDLDRRGLAAPDRIDARLILASEGAPGHTHDAEAWAPKDGIERTLFTALFNVLTAVGFALLLTAAVTLRGEAVTGRTGVLWGIAGFAAVSLAPALGLPPEVPGAMAAEVTARQAWWALAAVATGAGLWLAVLGRAKWMPPVGLLIIASPHIVGAPHPEKIGGAVPPELAAHFVSASLVTAAVFWVLLGWLVGRFAERLGLMRPAEA
ncbi:MAG: CbtA family protein [Rhodospirillaceae bacterium]